MKIKDCFAYCSTEKVFSRLEDFFKQCPPRVQNYLYANRISQGKILINYSMPPNTVYFLLKGRLQILDENAAELPLCFLEVTPFDITGDYEIFSSQKSNISTVTACTDCICLSLPAGIYRTWIKSDAHALFLRTQMLMKQLSTQAHFERRFLYTDYETRCIYLLMAECRYKKSINGQTRLSIKREELAVKAGCSLRTVNRIIENLKARDLISLKQGKIQINDSQQEALLSIVSPLLMSY